jgi:hypothetical protein
MGFKRPMSEFCRLDEEIRQDVGFEVLTAVVMKSTIFWDITPCDPLKVDGRFTGKYRLHPQGPRIEAICSSETSVDSQ